MLKRKKGCQFRTVKQIIKLPILEDNSKNVVEYIEQSNNKKKKKFNFWKLLETNE